MPLPATTVLLRCPACFHAARSIAPDTWECGPGHRFAVGPCPSCASMARKYPPPLDDAWMCMNPNCVDYVQLG